MLNYATHLPNCRLHEECKNSCKSEKNESSNKYDQSDMIKRQSAKRSNTLLNKMQSETAEFAPGAATVQTERNIRIDFDSGPIIPLYEKNDVTHITGST